MKNSVKKIIIGGACCAIAVATLSVGGVSAYKKSAEKNSIGTDTAYSLAIEDAGINKENAHKIRNDFEREDGRFVYEVEFDADGKEYDYIIDAKSGEIIEKESENEVPATPQPTPSETPTAAEDNTTQTEENETKQTEDETSTTVPVSDTEASTETTSEPAEASTNPADTSISLEKAKSIALSDAGIESANAVFTKAKLDKEDNCYDIEFISGNKKYEYEISAKNGRIIDKEIENIKTSTDNEQSSSVTLEKAKSIALSDAGIESANAVFTKAKLDKEDNCYDIEFISGNKKYEYEISAKNGRIIDKEIENIKTSTDASGNKGVISVDEAKEIALNKAGLKDSDVRFIKAKLDKDDGIQVYEIEFVRGRDEYEVEINALSGRILDYSKESDD